MCHALIIEDDRLAADYFGALAEMSGATSLAIAATEERAVSLASARRPTVIVSDVRLAEGCGRRAVERIQAAIGPVAILFVTGHAAALDRIDGSPPILAKPFLRDDFIAAFRRLALAA
jgi:CheY-like chemotaxis protein